jgi:transposase
MKKRYRVTLAEYERLDVQKLVSTGKAAAKKLVRARIVWLADQAEGGPGLSDPEIVAALGCGRGTVERVRHQVVEDGLEAAVQPPPRQRVYERRLDGKAEAHLVALACGSPPEGRVRWTLRRLAERMVALAYVEELSSETVRRTLKKTHSRRG